MDDTLVTEVIRRLDADVALAGDVCLLTLAALTGELPRYLDEGVTPAKPIPTAAVASGPAHAYVRSVTVRGFRGIGPEVCLELVPGPGLTLVIGRNGSGKSSFAEALELLLTGDNQRWSATRSKQWRNGWRNLHDDVEVAIRAELLIDGVPGPTVVRRRWAAAAELADGETDVRAPGGSPRPLATLGWDQQIVAYRPFLSYNELGSLLEDGPSKLHDALGAILGLEDLTTAADALAEARKERSRRHKLVKDGHKPLCAALRQVDDERAAGCLAAIDGRRWDLDAVAALVSGDEPESSDLPTLGRLRELARLRPPALDPIGLAAAEFTAALGEIEGLAGTDAEAADRLVSLLERAMAWHEHSGDGDCPVCGTARALDPVWHAGAASQLIRLRAAATDARRVRDRHRAAELALRMLLSRPPAPLEGGPVDGLDVEPARAAWVLFYELAAHGGRELAAAVEDRAVAVDAAVAALVGGVEARLAARTEVWRPLAATIAEWLGGARRMQAEVDLVKQLKLAEDWLRDAETTIRNERFAPIKEEVRQIWSELRTQSSVDLEDIVFAGKATGRRIDLEVTVDGTPGVALGVMSQGELHSLALSLFLPRATLAMSPFRFLFIDDPVQAMDPARVDGLARVLARVAATRQVVVFTHDDRLPEAVRRLGIEAAFIEVQRRTGSTVEVRPARDPVDGYIDDARALLNTSDLPPGIVGRVVPGLCRQSIEAACIAIYRRHRLGKGDPHEAIEARIAAAHTLMQRLALALFDDAARAGEVMTRVNGWGRWAGDVVQACNRGTHGEGIGDPESFVRDAKRLGQRLQGGES